MSQIYDPRIVNVTPMAKFTADYKTPLAELLAKIESLSVDTRLIQPDFIDGTSQRPYGEVREIAPSLIQFNQEIGVGHACQLISWRSDIRPATFTELVCFLATTNGGGKVCLPKRIICIGSRLEKHWTSSDGTSLKVRSYYWYPYFWKKDSFERKLGFHHVGGAHEIVERLSTDTHFLVIAKTKK